MDRRCFLKGMGSAFAGAAAVSNVSLPGVSAMNSIPSIMADDNGIPSPLMTKLNLKPVMTNIIHTGVWEGPCRFTGRTSVAEEKRQVDERARNWIRQMKSNKLNLDKGAVRIMEPTEIRFTEDFTISPEEFRKLDPDSRDVDAFFVAPVGSSVSAFDIGDKFNKPIIMVGLNCRNVDIAAYTKHKGNEAYVASNNEELHTILSLLQARKVFRNTKVLFPTNRGLPASCSVGSIDDLDDLKNRHGISVEIVSYEELADEVNAAYNDSRVQEKADQWADVLIQNAKQSYIAKEYVAKSIKFYKAVQNLMKKHDCNAFTVECFEFCSSQLPEKWNITPCLIHTLFRDRGFASSCEGDLGSLLAMRMLTSVSNKSCHQGNSDPRGENVFRINHSATGLKLNGYDKPDVPYKLGRFVQSGWGTKAIVDFMDNDEKTITVARVDPSATKLIILRGEIVGSSGHEADNTGCSVEALIQPPEGRIAEFLKKRTTYGNHLQWVYGDYTEEMQELAQMLNIEVEIIS